MASNTSLPSVGAHSHDCDKHSSTESTQTINGTFEYTHRIETYGEPGANAVNIQGIIIKLLLKIDSFLYLYKITISRQT